MNKDFGADLRPHRDGPDDKPGWRGRSSTGLPRRREAGWDRLRFWDEALVDPAGNPQPAGDHDWLLAQAAGMLNWRAAHRHCGTCGAPNRPDQGGNRLGCVNGHHAFPRTDPVVIMLVQHRDRVLMARGTRFPPGSRFLSALAGFLEPGESAEEAVAREVWEEVVVLLIELSYHSSQPWPFPGSLMLGFHAETDDDALTLDRSEIVEARWLTHAQLRNPEAHGFELPSRIAIARTLVESWLVSG